MRFALLAAGLLLAAVVVAPTAAALPPTWTPTTIALAMYVVGCTGSDVGYLTGDSDGCWGFTRAADCVARAVQAEVGLADECP